MDRICRGGNLPSAKRAVEGAGPYNKERRRLGFVGAATCRPRVVEGADPYEVECR